MGLPAATKPITIEEYLSDPAYGHCEFVDGHPVELNVGGKPHARIQSMCSYRLADYFRSHPGGYSAVELHCKLKIGDETRFRLPDVAAVLADDSPEQRYLDRAPDLVVEIRSPDDSLTAQMRKMEEYFANGAKLGWLILPEEKSVLVFGPEGKVRTVASGETLDGGDLLPDLKFPVEDLFA